MKEGYALYTALPLRETSARSSNRESANRSHSPKKRLLFTSHKLF
jgi:hypothetical protein